MKNCIYDIICIEDSNFNSYRPYIEKNFCKAASCSCKNCIYDVIRNEDSEFWPQIDKKNCEAPNCKCTNCILFIETDDSKDLRRIFKSVISNNKRSIKGNLP